MKKRLIFKGAATALITPFKGGKIDYSSLSRLIERQIAGGISAIVIGGTTGEAATLDANERYELFGAAKEMIGGRCKLVLGTGTNDTKTAISHAKAAYACGCDGILVVTPYYNKGTVRGVTRHYLEIAESVNLPIIVYNVPTRTGVNLTIPQLEELSGHENIVGIKEASDSLERLSRLSLFGDELYLYSGADQAICQTLAVGAMGLISVISNLYPCKTVELCQRFFKGDWQGAFAIQRALVKISDALFIETNPAPVKYILSRMALCNGELRLPLCEVTKESAAILDKLSDELSDYN